jgi:PAS domain S-box-containing protein
MSSISPFGLFGSETPSEVRALLRARDWEASPLGHPDAWPAEIRVLLRQLLASRFPMWLAWGPELRMIYNDAYCAILGSKHPQALGCPVRDVWSEIRTQIDPLLAQTLDGASTPVLATTYDIIRSRDTEQAWFNFALTPVRTDAGDVSGIFCVITESTSQVHAQQSIQRRNLQLEQQATDNALERDRLWRLSTDILLVADFTSRIIAVNPAWSTVLGRSEAESIGTDFMRLVHPQDQAATLAEVGKLERGIKTLHFENRYMHRDGSYRHISWTAVPEGQTITAVGRDATDQKNGAAALLLSESALLQSQKMESIGKLTGGVAHDFNNVLQIISGNLQLLQVTLGDNQAALKRVEASAVAVDRGARLASQLLAFARRQPLQPLVTNLGHLVRSMEGLLRRAVGETVDVEVVVSAGLWNTLVDPHQLENVLLNLAINARDAMGGEGRLTVDVSNSSLDEAYVGLYPGLAVGQYVLIAVTDTGHGMDKALIGKIFEPFFTTKKEGEGTGLGLSMAFGFAKQSGGHLTVYSEPGHGTTFKVYLPRSLEAVAEVPVVLTGPVLGGTETILVVEDDLHVQATVVDMLRGLGYSVLRANDARSAMAIVNSGVPIDLLFTDVVMPGELRSPDLARQAKALLPNLAVLFTSGYTQNAIVHGGRLDAGVELLSKPYRREDLARKLRHLLANQVHASSLNRYRSALPNLVAAVAPVKSGRHVLLIEDNDDTRSVTAELLTMLGHTVTAASSAEEALDLLATPGLQVLLTDISLPRMSGVELAAQVRLRRPEIDVIFCTGHTPQAAGVRDPAAKFLVKPFNLEQLDRLLQGPGVGGQVR